MKGFFQKIDRHLHHFFTLQDTHHNIAAGAALGIFLGILPGEGVAATLIIASLLGFNKASATIGVLATNMWATFAVAPLAAMSGGFIFGLNYTQLISNFRQTYHLGVKYFLSKTIFFDLALPLIVGFLVSAGLVALVFYFTIYFLLKRKKTFARG
ncbi:MAG: hypothetical protein ACD_56C00012G0004 [uncultured bacterium]|nr:MAG: hypothetical protein ACD_56C00012G0004 [uncultured bacterium]